MQKRKRGDRAKLRKSLKEANPLDKRLRFVREKLNLKLIDVTSATNIPIGCYSDRENGRRTDFYEELLVLAIYFNKQWETKKLVWSHIPEFEGEPVNNISVMWLLFGKEDPKLQEARQLLDNIQENYRRLELEQLERQLELESQLDMFKSPDAQNKTVKEIREKIERSKQNRDVFTPVID